MLGLWGDQSGRERKGPMEVDAQNRRASLVSPIVFFAQVLRCCFAGFTIVARVGGARRSVLLRRLYINNKKKLCSFSGGGKIIILVSPLLRLVPLV